MQPSVWTLKKQRKLRFALFPSHHPHPFPFQCPSSGSYDNSGNTGSPSPSLHAEKTPDSVLQNPTDTVKNETSDGEEDDQAALTKKASSKTEPRTWTKEETAEFLCSTETGRRSRTRSARSGALEHSVPTGTG